MLTFSSISFSLISPVTGISPPLTIISSIDVATVVAVPDEFSDDVGFPVMTVPLELSTKELLFGKDGVKFAAAAAVDCWSR